MIRLGEAALKYAERGWFVFPCVPKDKRPVTSQGFKDATTAPDQIAEWWRETPTANIGLWPGPSGLLVVDIDSAEGELLAARLGLLSEPTLQVRTVKGRHLYYVAPGFPIGNVDVGTGIDIRAHAGYVIAPPSIHPSGQPYRWEGRIASLLPCPAEFATKLRALGESSPAPVALDSPIAEHTRNVTLTRLAGRLLVKHPIADAIDLLWGVNVSQCRPVLERREVESIVASIAKREAKKVGATLEDPPEEAEPVERTIDRNFKISEDAQQSITNPADVISWGWSDMDRKFGGICLGRMYIVGARPGNGKTTWALNVLSHLWQEAVPTLYFGTEMQPSELVKKWAAMRRGLDELAVFEGRMSEPEKLGLRVEIETLMDQDCVTFSTAPRLDVKRLGSEIERAFDAKTGPAPRVLILDHLHRLAQDREGLEVLAKELADITVERNVAFIVAAQLNRDNSSGAFDLYLPPSLARYKGSAAIEENAAVGFGIFRPLKPGGCTRKEREQIENGERSVSEFAQPGGLSIICTKHRYHGAAIGRTQSFVLRGAKLEAKSWREEPA